MTLMFTVSKRILQSYADKTNVVQIPFSMAKAGIMLPLQLQQRGGCIFSSTMAANLMGREASLMEIL